MFLLLSFILGPASNVVQSFFNLFEQGYVTADLLKEWLN